MTLNKVIRKDNGHIKLKSAIYSLSAYPEIEIYKSDQAGWVASVIPKKYRSLETSSRLAWIDSLGKDRIGNFKTRAELIESLRIAEASGRKHQEALSAQLIKTTP